MPLTNRRILELARIGLQAELANLDQLLDQPEKRRGRPPANGNSTASDLPKVTVEIDQPQKRKVTAKGRKKMAEAQKKRWAEFHAAKLAASKKTKVTAKAKKVAKEKSMVASQGQ